MKDFSVSKKPLIELGIVSLIAAWYFSMVSNGGLCKMLLNGDSFLHRMALSGILTLALAAATVLLRALINRMDKTHSIRDMIQALLNTRTPIFFYILVISRLTQAVFYPYYTESKIYFVSYFLFFVYLIAIILAYIADHEKMQQTIAASTLLGCAGWCVGRILPDAHMIYDVFYFCILLANVCIVLYLSRGVTAKGSFEKIKGWVLRNKGGLAACLIAAAVGCCIEIVSAYYKGLQIMLPRCVFWAAVCTCVTTCAIFYRKRERFVERAFLCIALVVGIYMAVFMPLTTGVSWDDQIHYTHTVGLVQGENVTVADWSMAAIEKGIRGSEISQAEEKAYFDSLTEKEQSLSDPLQVGGDIQIYQKIAYIPNSIGLCIGQILNLPYGITFILGRISSVVFYALVIYAAMKRLTSGKLLLAIVALLPTNLFQAANYTYDAWIVCLIAFVMSVLIGWLQDEHKQIEIKDIMPMLAIMAMAIAPKGVYFLLILLLLLIPSNKFADRNQYRRFIFAVVGAMVVCFFAYMLLPFLGGKNQGDLRMNMEVSSKGQILYILTHPFTYAKKLFLFLKRYLSLENSFGYTCYFAYLSINRVDYHATLMTLLLVSALTDRGKEDRHYDTAKVKIGASALLYLTAALVATVMYMVCSPVGGEMGAGCQPRYLAPLVYPFLLLVCNFGCFKGNKKNQLSAVLLALSGYIVLTIIWTNIASQYVM